MQKAIHYLTENPKLIPLFLEDKLSLVGVRSEVEREALFDMLNGKLECYECTYWK